MRTETKTRTLYTFDELSDDAKEKAREWYREASSGDDFWHECVIEDFAENLAPILGWTISKSRHRPHAPAVFFSGFWSQGDGACFEGDWKAGDAKPGEFANCNPDDKEFQRIADGYLTLAKRNPDLRATVKSSGRYSHSHTMQFELEQVIEDDASAEYREPEALTDETEDEFRDLSRDLADWLYRTLEKEYEYQNADAQVDETIRANEYEFTEDGRRA